MSDAEFEAARVFAERPIAARNLFPRNLGGSNGSGWARP